MIWHRAPAGQLLPAIGHKVGCDTLVNTTTAGNQGGAQIVALNDGAMAVGGPCSPTTRH